MYSVSFSSFLVCRWLLRLLACNNWSDLKSCRAVVCLASPLACLLCSGLFSPSRLQCLAVLALCWLATSTKVNCVWIRGVAGLHVVNARAFDDIRTYIRTGTQHCVSALRCRDKNVDENILAISVMMILK